MIPVLRRKLGEKQINSICRCDLPASETSPEESVSSRSAHRKVLVSEIVHILHVDMINLSSRENGVHVFKSQFVFTHAQKSFFNFLGDTKYNSFFKTKITCPILSVNLLVTKNRSPEEASQMSRGSLTNVCHLICRAFQ